MRGYIHKILTAFSENAALRFLVTVVILYFLWELAYFFWIEDSLFSFGICHVLGLSTNFILQLLGYDSNWNPYAIYIDQVKMVYIDTPCNGLEFMGLFMCFVLAFPASLKSKLLFIPVGLILIHLLNMARVVLLVLNYLLYRATFEFNHHVTFTVLVYGLILVMCFIWAKKQSNHGQASV